MHQIDARCIFADYFSIQSEAENKNQENSSSDHQGLVKSRTLSFNRKYKPF